MRRKVWILVGIALLAVGCGGGGDADLAQTEAEGSAFEQGDFEAAFQNLEPLAAEGNADAQFRVGWMYLYGKGVRQDFEQADRWIREAAKQGHAEAQYNLALNYQIGRGVPQDDIQAFIWAALAAGQGYGSAIELRDDAATRMTDEEIAGARAKASEMLQ